MYAFLGVEIIFSIYLGKYKEVQWLNHIVRICCFIRNCQSVFQSSSVSFILISKEWESLLLTSSSAYNVVSVLDFCHSNKYTGLIRCCFNLHLHDDLRRGKSFHVFPIYFFGEMPVKHFGPFSNWFVCFSLLSFMSSLYILNINPLWGTSLENIFSHSLGYLFILLIVPFAVQKLFRFL